MTTSTHLSGRLNLGQIRESYLRDMLSILDSIEGSKCLVRDDELTGPSSTIVEMQVLKMKGVNQTIRSVIPGMNLTTQARNIIFLIRPQLRHMDVIADCVKRTHRGCSSSSDISFHIIFVPRDSYLCRQRLEQYGVLGSIQIHQLLVEVFPLDSDLMSMGLENLFRECIIDNDHRQLLAVARAVGMLQSLFGVVPNVRGKGPLAQRVFQLMLRLRKELSGKESPAVSQIDTLFLFDRSVDLLSPLATQLTYEGLLDEIYGIRNNIISLPGQKFKEELANRDADGRVKFVLNSSEDLFVELRDISFTAVCGKLSRLAKQLSKEEAEHKEAIGLPELRDFVSRLPKIVETKKSLSKHCTISELVQEHISQPLFTETIFCEQEFLRGDATADQPHSFIEDFIVNDGPLIKVIRLICMHSLTTNGLRPKVLEHYKREIIQQYGVDKLILLKNLETCGLLRVYQGSQKGYGMMLKTLKLTLDNAGEIEPTDITFVHQMYAPLSVRLLQFYGTPGWRAITDVLEVLPGATIEELQVAATAKLQRRGSRDSLQSGIGLEEKKLALVVFIGGCTFAEIAALRWLSQQDDCSMEFVVLTTAIINGNTLIETLLS